MAALTTFHMQKVPHSRTKVGRSWDEKLQFLAINLFMALLFDMCHISPILYNDCVTRSRGASNDTHTTYM